MRLDSDIKRDVEDELRWDPDIDATDIGVAVHNGVMTLTGFVRSYAQNAKRVAGVVGSQTTLKFDFLRSTSGRTRISFAMP
jgi:osmotically-inducible protein OsmY